MADKFKIGDRVKVNDKTSVKNGVAGVIRAVHFCPPTETDRTIASPPKPPVTSVQCCGTCYTVLGDVGGTFDAFEGQLEVAAPRPAPVVPPAPKPS